MAAAGHQHSLFLLEDGGVVAMGFGNKGQLGNGLSGYTSRQHRPAPVSLPRALPACTDRVTLQVKCADGSPLSSITAVAATMNQVQPTAVKCSKSLVISRDRVSHSRKTGQCGHGGAMMTAN